jgi:hypothetical protein
MALSISALDGPTLLGSVFDWIRDHVAQDRDPEHFSKQDLAYLARDIGVSADDVVRLLPLPREPTPSGGSSPRAAPVLPRAADNSLLIDRMMEARGLDPVRVRRSFAALLRDLELACARCSSFNRCRSNLLAGIAADHCHEYCPNDEAIGEIARVQREI